MLQWQDEREDLSGYVSSDYRSGPMFVHYQSTSCPVCGEMITLLPLPITRYARPHYLTHGSFSKLVTAGTYWTERYIEEWKERECLDFAKYFHENFPEKEVGRFYKLWIETKTKIEHAQEWKCADSQDGADGG